MLKTRFALTAALAAALAIPTAAQAEVDTTSITLNGGTLTFGTQPLADDFPATTLTGLVQVVAAPMQDWSVVDARGTGAGWNVSFAATQFSDGGTKTLPTGSLKLLAPTVAPQGVNLAVPPVPQVGPFTLDGGSATVAQAIALTGQGAWDFNHLNVPGVGDLQLTIPANAEAGAYTSNLTFTLGATP